MLSPRTKSALILIAASALSMSASAHTGVEAHSHSGFISGFVHPLFGLDHLAAMVAVGLWSALAARSAGRDLLWSPVGFAAMLLVGAVLGLQGVAQGPASGQACAVQQHGSREHACQGQQALSLPASS